jgi:hypothetical protein
MRVFNAFHGWLRKLRPEDPRRMREFRDDVNGLSWKGEHVLSSLQRLHEAVDRLAEAEVRYYYRRRGTRAWLSGLCRFAAWLCGTVGLLLPLLAATTTTAFKDSGQYGYVFLAAAASALGANSLFGGTAGHVRFVSTQLALEKLITSSRVEWSLYLATTGQSAVTEESLKAGFALISAYAMSLYSATIAETGHWAEMLVAELSKFEKKVDALEKKPPSNAP